MKKVACSTTGKCPKSQFFLFVSALFLGLLAAAPAAAQDVIVKKNGKEIRAQIVELGTAEVKYRLFDQPEGVIYAADKEDIQKIVFQDGHTEFYGAAHMDEATAFEGQKRAALKISFLGPLLGYTNIIYERNIRPGRSWETKATIVGLGKQYDDRPRGLIVSGAYKFYKKPDFYAVNFKRTHILQGGYIKPELFIGGTSRNVYTYSPTGGDREQREQNFAGGLLLNFGKQWVMDNTFVFDMALGIGYGAGTSTRSIYVFSDRGIGLATCITLNIGFVTK